MGWLLEQLPSAVRLTMMHGDGRINQIAAQRAQSRQGSIFVCAGKPAITDHIRDQNRRNLPGFAHGAPSGHHPA
jgi:hypothetical protein